MGTHYTEGNVVATPDGRGVVVAVLTDDFEFPQGDDDLTAVSTSSDQPAYVAALEQGGRSEAPGRIVSRTSLTNSAMIERANCVRP